MPSLLVLAWLAVSLLEIHQPEQEGRIVDGRTGRAIAGADVTIVGARSATRTDQDGRFRWPDVPTGAIVVVVILPDGRAARPMTIAAGERLQDLVLKIEAGYGESVTVPGVAPSIDVSAGASSTAVLEADLSLRRPATLAQSLENDPRRRNDFRRTGRHAGDSRSRPGPHADPRRWCARLDRTRCRSKRVIPGSGHARPD